MTDPVHKLGEVLRTAREAKGADLARVERETKIRERYLSALERGDYRDLPGAVYTRGFLRNYGAYLGLDADELIDLYRLETSVVPERASLPTRPKPLATRRARAFVLTPNVVVAAILTLMVGGFIAYLAYQILNFARTPDLRITDPPSDVGDYTELEITIRGETEPNARVTVGNLAENPTVTADAQGRFEVTLRLLPGSNVIQLTADDPVTGRRSETETRTVIVQTAEVSPSLRPAIVEVTEPVAGTILTGPVRIAGSAAPGASLTITPTLDRPPTPAFTIEDAGGAPVEPAVTPPTAPPAATAQADANGAYEASMTLPPGAWIITVAAESAEPATTSVAVAQAGGLAAQITIEGGESYLDLYEDGVRVADVSGRNAPEGTSVQLAADAELRIRVGNAAAVRLRVNGVDLGPMGGPGAVIEWRITRGGG